MLSRNLQEAFLELLGFDIDCLISGILWTCCRGVFVVGRVHAHGADPVFAGCVEPLLLPTAGVNFSRVSRMKCGVHYSNLRQVISGGRKLPN